MAQVASDRQAGMRDGRIERIRYRVGQFTGSLLYRVPADERAILALWLPPRAAELFRRMPRRDQRHSLDVFYTLRSAGCEQPDLLAAALLHDVGKTIQPGRRLRMGHRVLVVLLQAVSRGEPSLVERLASDDPESWRYPFHAHLHHPDQGARLAIEAGCTHLTASLIRHHQDPLLEMPTDEAGQLLALLQAADDMN